MSVQQDVASLQAMVVMPIGRWNQVLEILGERPWKDINALIVDIHRQLQDAVNAQSGANQQTMVGSQMDSPLTQPG